MHKKKKGLKNDASLHTHFFNINISMWRVNDPKKEGICCVAQYAKHPGNCVASTRVHNKINIKKQNTNGTE